MSDKPDRGETQKILDVLDYSSELSELRAAHHREMSGLLLSVLGVMDSFDRLLGEDPGTEQGITSTCRLIARQLAAALEGAGVREVPAAAATADPAVHQVVGVHPAVPAQHGTIVEVIRRGYEWHGRLLRPAQVIIGRSDEENSG